MTTPQRPPRIQTSRKSYPNWADILVWLLAFFVTAYLGAFFVGAMMRGGLVSEGVGVFLSYFLQFGLLIVFALWYRSRRTPGRKWTMRFSFRWWHLTQIFAGVILISAISLVIEPLIDLMPEKTLEQLNALMGRGGWMMLTAIAAAPILEEVFFRGIIQESLASRFRPISAILIASALFGVVHLIPQQVLNAFFVGLVLGYVYYRTASLVPVILIHAINNAVAYFTWLVCGEQLRTTRELLNDDTIYYILYGIAALVMLLAFIYMARNLIQSGKDLPPSDTNPAENPVDNK